MKKLIVLSLVLFFCSPLAAYAASIGGAETQGQGRLAFGLDTAFIFDRELEFKEATGLAANQEVKNLEMDEAYQAMLKVSYGLLEDLDVYVKLGVADYEGEAEGYVSGVKATDEKLSTDMDFAYGFGLKGICDLGNDWLLGYDLQYLRSKHKAKVTQTTILGAIDSTEYKSGVIQEWHIAPYVARRINNFTPYLGVRYSDVEMKLKSPAESGWLDNIKFESDNNVGVFVGTDYKLGENLVLNLEGRFIDETAMSFACTYKF